MKHPKFEYGKSLSNMFPRPGDDVERGEEEPPQSGLHDDRCASRKGYPCNCASAAWHPKG